MIAIEYEIYSTNKHRQIIKEGNVRFLFTESEMMLPGRERDRLLIGNDCRINGMTGVIRSVLGASELLIEWK